MPHYLRVALVLLLLPGSLVPAARAQPDGVLIDREKLPTDPDRRERPALRDPRIANVVILPQEEGWLPSHPLTPSFVLFIYGYHLRDEVNPVRIATVGAGNMRYTTIAEGDWGSQGVVDIEVIKRASEMHPRSMPREFERIQRAWARGWQAANVPAGPYSPDRVPHGVLVRADVTGPGSPANQRFSLRGARHAWTQPELPRRPEEFCPSLLLKSVHEDFVYRRWVGWDDIWGGVQLGTPPSMIPDSLLHSRETPASRLESQLYNMPQAIGETTPSRSVANACSRVVDDDAKNREVMHAMVAEYYWSKRRLRDGILVTMQNLVPLNKLKIMQCPRSDVPAFGASSLNRRPLNTPDTPIDHVGCLQYHRARGVPEICQRLKQECRADENFADMIEQADAVYRQWTSIEVARQRRGSIVRNSLTFPSDRQKALREMDQLREAQQALESINPWVAQSAFRDALAAPYRDCANKPTPTCDVTRPILACEAIRKQAFALEQKLLGHLDRFRAALDCIEGGPCGMSTDELRKTVHSAPPVLASPEPAAGEEYRRTAYANAQFDWANSRRVQRGYADNIDGALHDFYVGVALTGLTMGMGEVALALRGISAGATTTTAARASLTGARLLEAGAVLADLGASANEIRRAVAECTDAFADTTPLERVPFDTIRGPSCTGGGGYVGPRIVKDSQSCITRAVLMEIATGILPMVPGAVRQATDFTTLRRAGKVLGDRPPLNATQTNALTVLFSRRLRKMTPDEVADAVHQLRIAGFKDEEILKLLEALTPDLKKVGSRLVSGLRGTPGVNATIKIDGVEHVAVMVNRIDGTRLQVCSSCDFERVIHKLLKDDRLSPQGRKKLTELLEQIRELERRDLNQEQLAGQMGMIMRGLDELPADKDLIRDALKASNAASINPMIPAHNRPGGGRDFIAGLRDNPAPGTLDNLQPVEALIESGRLTRETYAKAATILDESLYLARLSGDNPASRLVRRSDLNRLDNMANDLGAALGLDRQLNKDIIEALVARYRSAKAAGNQTMSGELITAMAHADVDIPRTTAELRLMVNSREFPDPFGTARVPKLGERIEADHILSVASIKKRIPEYAQLDWAKREEVLHNKENIAGLPKELNMLKSDHDVNGFEDALKKKYGPDARLSDHYKDWLGTKQACMEALIRAQIRCLVPLQPGADYKICNPPKDFKPRPGC